MPAEAIPTPCRPATAPRVPIAGAPLRVLGRLLVATSMLLPAALPGTAHAERTDRTKPINVEADRMEYDDLKQVNVFVGNVTLTKGTIVIRGDRLTIRQDAEGFQYGTAVGSAARPATFRQKREGPGDLWIEGFGLQLEYNGRTEVVTFKGNARLRRLDKERVTDDVLGNTIVYQSLSEYFTVESGGAGSNDNPTGRVRVVIQPKNGGAEPPAPVPLTPAPRLDTPRAPEANR